jgi:hypothetical protein
VIRRSAVLVLAAAVLTGCSGTAEPTSDQTVSSPSPASSEPATVAASPSGDAEALGRAKELAQLAIQAQEAAASLNAVTDAELEPHEGPVLGADISWPQCPPGMGIPHKISSGQPMPREDAEYVILGLTHGPGFHANPCLADQVAWARERGLLVAAYSVISWPDQTALKGYGGLEGAGHAQAEFNIAAMKAAGLDSPIIWLDVEQVPDYEWSRDVVANAQVVVGAAQGYVDAGYRVGVYSTPAIWSSIVGDLSLGAPEWRAAGQTSRAEAESRCGPDWVIQGGEAVLTQWVEEARDRNVTCPGTEARMSDYFTTLT